MKSKNITRTLPIHDYVLRKMEDQLEFGNVIKWKDIEEHADMSRIIDGQDNPSFQFLMVHIRHALELQGKFITERGIPHGFRIKNKEEIAAHLRSDLIKKVKSMKRKAIGAGTVSTKDMNSEECKKLEHEAKRTAWMVEVSEQMLRKRKLPEATSVQSIKQLISNA